MVLDELGALHLSTEGDGVEGQSPNCHWMRTLLKSRADVMVRCLQ